MRKFIATAQRTLAALGKKDPSILVDVATVILPWVDHIYSMLSIK